MASLTVPEFALSIRQPYASLLVAGIKRFEARTWCPSKVPITIAIHASSAYAAGWKKDVDHPALARVMYAKRFDPIALPTSAIIGVVRITEATEASSVPDDFTYLDMLTCGDPYYHGLSLWRVSQRLAVRPIRCKGKLNLWKLSPDQKARLTRRLRG
ncbi:MAG: ASCH domain-containing protein [Gemmatimonadaceae bacterium]